MAAERLTVAVSGSSGLVGAPLCIALSARGHTVRHLVRRWPPANGGDIFWDPTAGKLDGAGLAGVDAVVHLAGESVAGRWSRAKKERIRTSRVSGTRLLAGTLARLPQKPRVLVAASAVGYYGTSGENLDETAPPADDFLGRTCREWEQATEAAAKAGIRVVLLRFGTVLAKEGGALGKLLPAFRAGLGGRVGSGRQWMSWIALDDAIRCIDQALVDERWQGPINVVAPAPVTNREFVKTLGKVLRRPTFLPLPGALVKAAFGEMGETLLLGGAGVVPRRLEALGFAWQHPTLEGALRHALE